MTFALNEHLDISKEDEDKLKHQFKINLNPKVIEETIAKAENDYSLIAEWLATKGFDPKLVQYILTMQELKQEKKLPKSLRDYGFEMYLRIWNNPLVYQALKEAGLNTELDLEIWLTKLYDPSTKSLEIKEDKDGKIEIKEVDLAEDLFKYNITVARSPFGDIKYVDWGRLIEVDGDHWYFNFFKDIKEDGGIIIANNGKGKEFLIFQTKDGRELVFEIMKKRKPTKEKLDQYLVKRTIIDITKSRIYYPFVKYEHRPDLTDPKEERKKSFGLDV